jgi:hypothetical protein
MTAPDKIYVDASQSAILRHGDVLVDCPTLQEAVLAWHKLPEGDREKATIKVKLPGGEVYTAREIERLHYGPKPK